MKRTSRKFETKGEVIAFLAGYAAGEDADMGYEFTAADSLEVILINTNEGVIDDLQDLMDYFGETDVTCMDCHLDEDMRPAFLFPPATGVGELQLKEIGECTAADIPNCVGIQYSNQDGFTEKILFPGVDWDTDSEIAIQNLRSML